MSKPFEVDIRVEWFQSPGYLLAEIPPEVREEIELSIHNIQRDKKLDARAGLKGHLAEEYHLPITPKISRLMRTLSYEYEKQFKFKVNHMSPVNVEEYDYELQGLWINYQKKHDFNPIHIHNGAFSFVIWVQIPWDNIDDEMAMYKPNGNETAMFSFRYIDAMGYQAAKYFPLDSSWNWKMAFFPAGLNHSVNPFYTTDDYRISISGNVFAVPTKADFLDK